jgi:hypothetical protein
MLAVLGAVGGGASDPGRIVLTGPQVGPGYRLHQRADGHGVRGFVTLNMCGTRFPSEDLRTARLQVDYSGAGTTVKVSNEVVAYRRGGARQALREVAYAADHCPRTPVPSGLRGVGPLTYLVSRVVERQLPAGSVALLLRIRGAVNGSPLDAVALAVYERRGDVLSAVYATGADRAARLRIGVHAAVESAANLRHPR